jgi:VWFA-related protein
MTRPRAALRICLPLALSPLLLAAAAPPRQPAAPRFEGTSQVVAVEVPVNVSSRDGRPLRGLKAADFEVYDEGRRQTLTGFDVVDLDVLEPAPVADSPPVAPPRAGELPSPARRRFLLLFDLSFSSPTSVLKARVAARDFMLHSLRPTDLAAVATYTLETGPRLVVTFTPDRAQLARGIDTLGQRRPGEALPRVDPLHFLIDTPHAFVEQSSGVGQGNGQQDLASARTNAESALLDSLKAISKQADKLQKGYETSQIKAYTRSMGDLARALDSVPGRKHVVLFSEGFDSRLLLGRDPTDEASRAETQEEQLDIEQNALHFVDNDNRFGSTEVQSAVKAMLERFRRADCVIEAVDIGGLRTSGGIGSGNDVNAEAQRRSGEDSLFYLANETGGELFKDTNNLREQLGHVLERSSVTYLLSFERSDLKADGAYHRLRVKANLPSGAHLSYRAGYFAPRPFRELDPLEKNLLAGDGIAAVTPRHDLDLSLLVAPFRTGAGPAYVPVIVEVGGKSLLAGQAENGTLGLEIYAYVSDERGEMRDYFSQVVGLDLGKAGKLLAEGGLKYYGHLELAPGRYRVRVLVRNRADGRAGVASTPVEVPAWEQAAPELLPPLFFQAPGRWLLVRERPREGARAESVVYPFTVKGEPYVPEAKPALAPAEKARLCLVAYNLGPGDLHIGSQVLDAAGRPLAGGLLSGVERTATGIAGVDKLLATFEPTGLPAGDYVLRVAVRDPRTGSQRANSVPFAVR